MISLQWESVKTHTHTHTHTQTNKQSVIRSRERTSFYLKQNGILFILAIESDNIFN